MALYKNEIQQIFWKLEIVLHVIHIITSKVTIAHTQSYVFELLVLKGILCNKKTNLKRMFKISERNVSLHQLCALTWEKYFDEVCWNIPIFFSRTFWSIVTTGQIL